MNRLNGVISDNIFKLVNLKFLIIINTQNDPLNKNRNKIFRIPNSLRNFTNLKEFIIRDAYLKMTLDIPNFINYKLEILDLSFNRIKANLIISDNDVESWNSNKFNNKLKILDLSNNNCDKNITSIKYFPKTLQIIRLQNNNFTGAFPYLENHQDLKALDLRNNSLTGVLDVIFL